jgi:TLD
VCLPVLQLLPRVQRNDFFQWGCPNRLALGCAGGPAIMLDSDLLRGFSTSCLTYGSPCLAGGPDFRVAKVEVWSLAGR